MFVFRKILSRGWRAILLSAFLCSGVWADCAKDYSIAVFDWRKTDGEAGKTHGFELDQEIWQRVFDRAGCQIEWQIMTAKRLLHRIEIGSLDGAIPASQTPDRQKFAHFSEPYRVEELVGFVRQDRASGINATSIPDIREAQLTLALAYGGWYGPEVDAMLKNDLIFKDKVRFTDDAMLMVDWVLTGHADMMLSWRAVAERLLKRRGLLGRELVTHPAVFYEETSHLMLSKKSVSAEDVAFLNSHLKAFMATDVYQSILEAY